jgi:hypothetical protein
MLVAVNYDSTHRVCSMGTVEWVSPTTTEGTAGDQSQLTEEMEQQARVLDDLLHEYV